MNYLTWDNGTTFDSTSASFQAFYAIVSSGTTTGTTIGQWQQYNPNPVPVLARNAAPLEFNKYINASDMLEEFIKWVGKEGVRRHEVMGLPLELFIKWLIIQACEQDGEEPNVQLALPAPRHQPRCLGCGRWMKAEEVIYMHDQRCAGFYYTRKNNAVSVG